MKEQVGDLGSGAEMGREVVPGGIKRGQTMQGQGLGLYPKSNWKDLKVFMQGGDGLR